MRAAKALSGGDKRYVPNNGWCDVEELAEIIDRETGAAEMLETLRSVLASANPHPEDNPSMFAKWKAARAVIAKHTQP